MVTSRKRKRSVEDVSIEPSMTMSTEKGPSVLERFTPVLLIASILLAFAVGVLWQKVQNLEKVGSVVTTGGAQGTAPSAPTNPSGKLTEDQAKNLPEVSTEDHIKGNKNAKIFLIEYSDFQCPYCKQFHPTAQKVVETYGNDVAWVYRHFPLDQIHPNARPSAEASECVAELGGNDAFWKFADLMFSDTTSLTNLQGSAEKVGVSGSAFKTCYDAGKFKTLVEETYQAGIKAGVTGTPANFIVNAKGEVWLVPGALPFEQLKTTIDEALK